MKQAMQQLLVQLRAIQLYAHSAHNLVARAPFGSDHDLMGSFYSEAESDYDMLAERCIGLGMEDLLHTPSLMQQLTSKISPLPCHDVKENKVFFQILLGMEKELCQLVTMICQSPECSVGTQQLLGDFCNRSESRQYKQKQRIK